MNALASSAHRPWPLPDGPWVMAQTWHDLLFAHWAVPIEAMRVHVPRELAIDTFGGRAWLGVVPFRMSGVRLRFTPSVPWLSAFPELNLRTYVSCAGKPGVFFFALEAANPFAVAIARRWFHLPYFRARMSCDADGADIRYASDRTHSGARPATVRARYGPLGPVELARAGSLEHWLTERYCLYAVGRKRTILRGEVHHAPWPLQPAQAEFDACTLPEACGIALPDVAPHLAFARRLDVVVWAPQSVSDPAGAAP